MKLSNVTFELPVTTKIILAGFTRQQFATFLYSNIEDVWSTEDGIIREFNLCHNTGACLRFRIEDGFIPRVRMVHPYTGEFIELEDEEPALLVKGRVTLDEEPAVKGGLGREKQIKTEQELSPVLFSVEEAFNKVNEFFEGASSVLRLKDSSLTHSHLQIVFEDGGYLITSKVSNGLKFYFRSWDDCYKDEWLIEEYELTTPAKDFLDFLYPISNLSGELYYGLLDLAREIDSSSVSLEEEEEEEEIIPFFPTREAFARINKFIRATLSPLPGVKVEEETSFRTTVRFDDGGFLSIVGVGNEIIFRLNNEDEKIVKSIEEVNLCTPVQDFFVFLKEVFFIDKSLLLPMETLAREIDLEVE